MKTAPKGLRLHIGLFGRRNAGKSSLLNAMTRQEVSIVSEIAGTTTDPVEKPMELLPLGPVLWIDTAGIDDQGRWAKSGCKRPGRCSTAPTWASSWSTPAAGRSSRKRSSASCAGGTSPSSSRSTSRISPSRLRFCRRSCAKRRLPSSKRSPATAAACWSLREALIQAGPEDFLRTPALVADLVPPGEMAVLVVPIDLEAPKGRLIVPQVQAIRDLLDGDAYCLVVKERELRDALGRLNRPPALVVTDSQAFLKVSADTPPDVKMTSFSILFARQKGDLCQFVEGALAIERLRPGDRVLVAEACTHHPIGDDIGRVKIPRWLKQYVGGELRIDTTQGHDFPADLGDYRLVVHCGACMWNRREMLTRLAQCRRAGVPICNYGMTIAYTLGIFDRALAPFPDALETYRRLRAGAVQGLG